MTDIFISYSSKDRAWVQGLASALEEQGYRVWWDTGLLSGDDFHNTIPEKLAEAACVIVVWTPNSVESIWVKAEANRGLRRKVLIPVLAGDAEIPIPFDMIHTDNFQAWQGDAKSPEFKRLVLSVARYTEPSLLLEQAQREAEVEAERRRKAAEEKERQTALEVEQKAEQARKEKAAAEKAEQEHQQREQEAAEKARLAKEAQARRIAEQRERERLEAEKAADAQRQAERERQQAQTVQSEQPEAVAANDSEASVSSIPQKAGMGTGVKIGGGLAAVGVVAALVYLGAKPSPAPDPVYLSEPVATSSTGGSEPDASGFQALADPGQMGKVDFSEPEMVRIEGGSFKMGCVSGKSCSSNEKPVHTVNVPSFEIGKYEVTFDEWDACVTEGGCSHKIDDEGWGRGKRPVINVSWNDVQDQYIPWLNKKTGKQYRLPTEAEWEYAARAGTKTAYPWGDDIDCSKANYGYIGDYCKTDKTKAVGGFATYGGVHDMNGNVWEWVQDCYHDYKGAPTDGSTWDTKCGDTEYRVLRGGSWRYIPEGLRSAFRDRNTPTIRHTDIGFRLARTL